MFCSHEIYVFYNCSLHSTHVHFNCYSCGEWFYLKITFFPWNKTSFRWLGGKIQRLFGYDWAIKNSQRPYIEHVKTIRALWNLQLFVEHRAWMEKFPISDRFCKIHCNSLNMQPIRIILGAFERCDHLQDNPGFKNAKIFFFGVGKTYKLYFRGWICPNHGLHASGTYGVLWVGSNICKSCIQRQQNHFIISKLSVNLSRRQKKPSYSKSYHYYTNTVRWLDAQFGCI